MEERTTADGETLYLGAGRERGSKGPFRVAYRSPDGERRYGWWCEHCGSAAVAMDAMGRLQCSDCSNTRKPTEWDAAHE